MENYLKTNLMLPLFTVTRYVLSFFAFLITIEAIILIIKRYKHIPSKITMANLIMNETALALLIGVTYLSSWALGTPITQILGFDPVLEKNGIQILNSICTGSNLVNLLLFWWILFEKNKAINKSKIIIYK